MHSTWIPTKILATQLTCIIQFCSPRLCCSIVSPNLTIIVSTILHIDIKNGETTSGNICLWLSNDWLINSSFKFLVVSIPEDIHMAKCTSSTCEHSTEWSSCTFISRMSDDIRSRDCLKVNNGSFQHMVAATVSTHLPTATASTVACLVATFPPLLLTTHL